ncbi:MAG: hypothetical protein EBU01_09165, partial [Crocinitomicaceae bacterium]|nr:hypothetical protein [Crocinitomicaceae bacterium]
MSATTASRTDNINELIISKYIFRKLEGNNYSSNEMLVAIYYEDENKLNNLKEKKLTAFFFVNDVNKFLEFKYYEKSMDMHATYLRSSIGGLVIPEIIFLDSKLYKGKDASIIAPFFKSIFNNVIQSTQFVEDVETKINEDIKTQNLQNRIIATNEDENKTASIPVIDTKQFQYKLFTNNRDDNIKLREKDVYSEMYVIVGNNVNIDKIKRDRIFNIFKKMVFKSENNDYYKFRISSNVVDETIERIDKQDIEFEGPYLPLVIWGEFIESKKEMDAKKKLKEKENKKNKELISNTNANKSKKNKKKLELQKNTVKPEITTTLRIYFNDALFLSYMYDNYVCKNNSVIFDPKKGQLKNFKQQRDDLKKQILFEQFILCYIDFLVNEFNKNYLQQNLYNNQTNKRVDENILSVTENLDDVKTKIIMYVRDNINVNTLLYFLYANESGNNNDDRTKLFSYMIKYKTNSAMVEMNEK